MESKANKARNLLGLSRSELEQFALSCGRPRYRGAQIYHGIYARRERNFQAMTDLDRGFREYLSSFHEVAYPEFLRAIVSRDESVRYLFGLSDGSTVEAVYMPWRLETRDGRPVATPSGRELRRTLEEANRRRSTLCISSQAGCAVDCKFCFTGLLGLKRNLTAGEIVGQVLAIAEAQQLWGPAASSTPAAPHLSDSAAPTADGPGRQAGRLGQAPETRPRLNVVFMGQGEPLLNFGAVMKAVQILADPSACGIPPRRITLSTAGIVPHIYDLAREPVRPKLAISLNASTEEQRSALMPINRKYSLKDLLGACRVYPLRPRERLTFEYVMIDGINDSEVDAARVAELLRDIPARVNLIPYNPGDELPYRSPPIGRVLAFQKVLATRHVPAFIRISRGQDIMAACGQLSLAEPPHPGSSAATVSTML